jgi:hypothetical protein
MPPTTLAAATPFPIPPDGESTVTLSRAWLTNVQSTESGAEVRAGLRTVPRRTLTYTALFENAQLAGQFRALWANAAERLRFVVPLWPRYAVPEAFPDTSTISGDFADRGFVAGDGMAMLWQSETEFELLDVETVADDELTLSTPIAGDFALGAVRVLPVITAWLEPPTLAQLTVVAEQLPVAFTEELPGIVGIDPDVGDPESPIADAISVERVVESSPWGPQKFMGVRVTVFDAAGMPIPSAPLTWTITPNFVEDYIQTFPGNGNLLAVDYPGNAFAGFSVTVESGSASLAFGIS